MVFGTRTLLVLFKDIGVQKTGQILCAAENMRARCALQMGSMHGASREPPRVAGSCRALSPGWCRSCV